MRKAPKKPFKFLKNPDFLNISLDAPKGLWRFLEVSGGSSGLLEAPGVLLVVPEGLWRFLEVSGGP